MTGDRLQPIPQKRAIGFRLDSAETLDRLNVAFRGSLAPPQKGSRGNRATGPRHDFGGSRATARESSRQERDELQTIPRNG